MNDCVMVLGTFSQEVDGVNREFVGIDSADCESATHRFIDVQTYDSLEATSLLNSEQAVQALMNPIELTAAFSFGFMAIFTLSAIAYKINVAKIIINKT